MDNSILASEKLANKASYKHRFKQYQESNNHLIDVTLGKGPNT